MWRERVKSCLVKRRRRCQGAKRERELQRNGVRIEERVAVLVTQKAMPACFSIDTDGTTMHVCGSMSKVALLSSVYPFATCVTCFCLQALKKRWKTEGWWGCRVSSVYPPSNVKVSALAAKFSDNICDHQTRQPLPAVPV